MATKSTKQKAKPKTAPRPAAKASNKATPRRATKPELKAPPKKTQKVAAAVAKRVAAPPPKASLPKGKIEPPPVDHGASIGPLYLGAGHGHLGRAVDKGWLDALERYRKALDEAIAYERKRTPVARASMVITFGRQVQTLMNNLAARVQAIAAEVQGGDATARESGRLLVAELKRLNASYGALAGPGGMAPLGDDTLASGVGAQLEQLQRGFFNNIARWADLERALS